MTAILEHGQPSVGAMVVLSARYDHPMLGPVPVTITVTGTPDEIMTVLRDRDAKLGAAYDHQVHLLLSEENRVQDSFWDLVGSDDPASYVATL